jgi:hypothetical protein
MREYDYVKKIQKILQVFIGVTTSSVLSILIEGVLNMASMQQIHIEVYSFPEGVSTLVQFL